MQGKVFLGRYEVQRLLGEGGMGRVYLAKQSDLKRMVVIKVMHEHVATDPKFQERFQREMLLMAQFQHPYAVTLYDASGDTPEGPCIVMEFVRGETLETILRREKRLSPHRVGRLLGQICEVLQYAHNQGIIHRDLKPSNLMVIDTDTPYEKIKVMDFGLAKLIDAQSIRHLADSGSDCVIGTPAYMCPEQARGEETDHRCDIYSLGVMLYELLTGKLPFDGMSTMDTLLAHASESPPPMGQKGREEVWIPPAIEQVVMSCLSKRPENRPAGAMELAQAFEEALFAPEEETVSARVDTPLELEDAPPPAPEGDAATAVFQMQAWMPESIAAYKLRGFIHDAGGEVVDTNKSRIRVLLGGRNCAYRSTNGKASWLGFGGSKQDIELELQLWQATNARQNNLWVTVILRYLGRAFDSDWRNRAEQVFRDLRAYLIGTTAAVAK